MVKLVRRQHGRARVPVNQLAIFTLVTLVLTSCSVTKPTPKVFLPPPSPQANTPVERHETHSDLSSVETLYMPVRGVTPQQLRSNYGDPRDGGARIHKGLDIMAPEGHELIAIRDGYLTRSSNRLGGNALYLRADNGYQYYYAHLSRYVSGLPDGSYVRAGQVIGYVGHTGNASANAPHLHVEFRRNGDHVDPYPILKGRNVAVIPLGNDESVFADNKPAPMRPRETTQKPKIEKQKSKKKKHYTNHKVKKKQKKSRDRDYASTRGRGKKVGHYKYKKNRSWSAR